MSKFRIYTAAAALIAILIIIFQNTENVDTKLLFATITMPRAALLGLTLLIGIIIGWVFAKLRARAKAKAHSAQVK